MAARHEAQIDSSTDVTDEVSMVIKGPDPEVWGDHEDRLAADLEAGKITNSDVASALIAEKLAAGEDPIVELPDGSIVKGPDPTVWGFPDDPEDDDTEV